MAFEEVLQLLAKREALEAKRAEVMRLSMLATAEMLASGEVAPGDPELVAVAARAEAHGLATVRAAAEQAEQDARMAARYAAEPGGEAVAEAGRARRRAGGARRVLRRLHGRRGVAGRSRLGLGGRRLRSGQ